MSMKPGRMREHETEREAMCEHMKERCSAGYSHQRKEAKEHIFKGRQK